MAELRTFRDTIRKVSPTWLRVGVGEKLLYSIAIQADGLMDALVAAVRMRFPDVESDESLPYLGRDRRIRRGRDESSAAYSARLRRWLTDHRTRGGPYAMLAQVHAHYSGAFPVDLVYYSGRRFQMDVAGDVVRDDYVWTPDGDAARWPRWWLFYEWPDAVAGDGTWASGGTWDDGGVWDSTLTVAEVADIRLVPKEWNAAHASGQIVLLYGGLELWDYPEDTWDSGGVWDDTGPVLLGVG